MAESIVSYLWFTLLPSRDAYLNLALAGGFVLLLRLAALSAFLAANVGALHFSFAQFRSQEKHPSRSRFTEGGLPWMVP